MTRTILFMARKKRKTKKGGGLFSSFSKKKKGARSKKNEPSVSSGLKITAGIVLVTILIAGATIGFIYLDRYVKTSRPTEKTSGALVLVEPGIWVNDEWKQKIENLIGSGPFTLDENSAKIIAQKLQSLSWLDHVRAQTTPEKIKVYADYRRPVGMVDLGRNKKVYLDAQMTVMDYIPVTAIPTIEIKGIASPGSMPTPGNRWAAEDARAGVELLDLLYKMDLHFQREKQLEKPLLDEIESIDVANFAARKSNSAPHLFLTVKDGTRIFWGAAWGQASRYLEQDEKDKLTDLYQFFMDHNNTLQGTAKYIELRQL